MSRRLIVADDFGLCPQGDSVIVSLLRQGAISGTSVLMGTRDSDAAFADLRQIRREGRVLVGLHFNLTLSFAGEPKAPSVGRLLSLSLARRLDPQLARVALKRQFDQFMAVFGQPPDFLDGHQHVHVFPLIREAAAEILSREALPKDFWVRLPDEAGTVGWGRAWRAGGAKALIVSALARGAAPVYRGAGLAVRQRFVGFQHLTATTERFRQSFREMVVTAPSDALIMVHPGSEHSAVRLPGHDNALKAIEAEVLAASAANFEGDGQNAA
jgi:chitin disaccharide deacetylase